MVEGESALEKNYSVGKYPNKKNIGIVFEEKKNYMLFQAAGWPESITTVGNIISDYLKITSYPNPNQVIDKNGIIMMRVEPLKWWILGSDLPKIDINQGTILDLSHSFTQIKIEGSITPIFLNKFLPLDLREKSFPINSIASSSIHHVSVKLLRLKNEWRLFIPRGFAFSLWTVFLTTADQFGYEIK